MSTAARDQARLRELASLLRHFRATLRYVDYRQAERDAERLGEKMRQVYSGRELARARFAAIPRGGHIVLGMLSYVLDLRPEQLRPAAEPADPLVVVDDCALTGARFAAELAAAEAPRVDFVHLYSHPRLRRAIVAREPRVEHCLAARDLADQAPEIFPEAAEYRAWQERWQARLGPDRYWLGLPELICFAWNEPDRPFWNAAAGRAETGWRFLPPHLCLEHRTHPGPSRGEWRHPADVVAGEFDGVVWLYQVEADQLYSFEGASADMWRWLAEGAATDDAVAWLVAAYEIDEPTARADLSSFAERLASQGLLERVPSGDRDRGGVDPS